jgi:hypothetical protein
VKIMAQKKYRFSLYTAVVEERQRLAEIAYLNHQTAVEDRDFVGALVSGNIILALSVTPHYAGKIFWFNDGGGMVFPFLHINFYLDMFIMFFVPFIVSVLIVWYLVSRKIHTFL